MRHRLAGILAYLCFTGVVLASSWQNPPSQWKEYSYPDDGFLISAPAEPVVTKSPPLPPGQPEPHNYAIDLGNDCGVMVSSTEIKGAESVSAKSLLAGAKNGAIQAVKAKLTGEKEITLEEYSGIEFEADTETYHMRARMYVVKSKLLSLLAVAPKGTPVPAEAGRVLDSLKLAKQSGTK